MIGFYHDSLPDMPQMWIALLRKPLASKIWLNEASFNATFHQYQYTKKTYKLNSSTAIHN